MPIKSKTLKSILNNVLNKFDSKVFRINRSSLCTYCKSKIKGHNNLVEIGSNCRLLDCTFFIKGNNNHIVIEEDCMLDNVSFWISDDNNFIKLGRSITIGKRCEFAALEGCQIVVGDNCLFSHDIRLRTSDSHSIIDVSGKRINPAKDISIGKHCWIGMQSLFLKGACVGDDCIVGARSMVSHEFGSNMVIAGQPARILKEDVNWNVKRL